MIRGSARGIAFGLAAVVVVAVVAFTIKHESGTVAGAGEAPGYTAPTLPDPVTSSRATLGPLPTRPKVLIVGDSWTVGYGADNPATQGWAPVVTAELGWDATIDGFSGSGYVKAAAPGGTFATAITAAQLSAGYTPQLVVLQGSINDQGEPSAQVAVGFTTAISAVRSRFPGAQILIVGPVAEDVAVTDEISDLDSVLAARARTAGVPYIDGMTPTRWFSPSQFPTMINAAKTNHPTTAGYRAFATAFESAYKAIGAS